MLEKGAKRHFCCRGRRQFYRPSYAPGLVRMHSLKYQSLFIFALIVFQKALKKEELGLKICNSLIMTST